MWGGEGSSGEKWGGEGSSGEKWGGEGSSGDKWGGRGFIFFLFVGGFLGRNMRGFLGRRVGGRGFIFGRKKGEAVAPIETTCMYKMRQFC